MPTALVTGGSRGIGAAVSARLAGKGWKVITVSRTAPARPAAFRHESLDVADPDAVAALGRRLGSEGVRLHGLVNNAGLQGGLPISEQPRADWQRYFDVNVTGAWAVTQSMLPLMPEGSSIVNLGSVASVRGFAGRAAYCASKHALLGLTLSLAAELAPRRIRVNHLVLGSFATPGLDTLAAENGADMSAYAERQLLGRLGRPEEAAAACEFLMSEDAGFVTGASLNVDGGLLLNAARNDPERRTLKT